jgi:hypothetical protein
MTLCYWLNHTTGHDRLTEIGRYYVMEMNLENSNVMQISRKSSQAQIMIDEKQLENVEYFSYLGSMITNDARCRCEIKSRISMVKAAFNRKEDPFPSANWT